MPRALASWNAPICTRLAGTSRAALRIVRAPIGGSPEAAGAPASDDPRVVRLREQMVGLRALPPPERQGGIPLFEALHRRRSARNFSSAPLSPAELSQLLWSAQGATAPWGGRAVPSAGALYPLELYLLTADGLWRYVSQDHALQVLSERDLRPHLARASLGQAAVADAAAVFVVAAAYERTAVKYGPRRARRYATLEAGHAAQNLLLAAVAMDLAAVPIGAFEDEQVASTLGLPDGESPLYLIAVGRAG